MNYTLDSVKHFRNCLKELKRDFDVSKPKPLYLSSDKTELTNSASSKKTYYFGVLTVGSECTADLYFDGNKVSTVRKNSQIITEFSHVVYHDLGGNEITDSSEGGSFRGFQMNLISR